MAKRVAIVGTGAFIRAALLAAADPRFIHTDLLEKTLEAADKLGVCTCAPGQSGHAPQCPARFMTHEEAHYIANGYPPEPD